MFPLFLTGFLPVPVSIVYLMMRLQIKHKILFLSEKSFESRLYLKGKSWTFKQKLKEAEKLLTQSNMFKSLSDPHVLKSRQGEEQITQEDMCERTMNSVKCNAPVLTLTCRLTLARDEGLPKGLLQRAVPVQEPVAGRDGHVGGAINGLGGGCVGAQLFSCDLPINLTRGRVVSFLSPHSGLPCSPAHIPCSHPSSIPGSGDSSGRHVGAWDGPRQGQTAGERRGPQFLFQEGSPGPNSRPTWGSPSKDVRACPERGFPQFLAPLSMNQ